MAFVGVLGSFPATRRSCRSKIVACAAEHGGSSRREFLKTIAAVSITVPSIPVLSEDVKSFYDLKAGRAGVTESLKAYEGKLVLVVNVATYCALTNQYEGLAKLYDKYHDQGFEILAFPCNQFGNQEPGSYDDICQFAREQYGAKFDIFDKVNVNPPSVDPVYTFLKSKNPDSDKRIEWNFAKFLVDQNGDVIRRYKPGILPNMLEQDIATLFGGKPLPPRPKPQLGAV